MALWYVSAEKSRPKSSVRLGSWEGRIYNDIAGDGHCDIGDARQQVAFVSAARAQSARELMSGDLPLQNNRTALVELALRLPTRLSS